MTSAVTCPRCQSLEAEMASVSGTLTLTQAELASTTDKLSRVQSLFDRGVRHIEELQVEIKLLRAQVQALQSLPTVSTATRRAETASAATQTDPEEDVAVTDAAATECASLWFPKSEAAEEGEIVPTEPVSIADSLRETAEAFQEQSGYQYDERTKMYYNKETGYYYDWEKGLYYEPYSMVYYSFNTETNSYDFHSQVDMDHFTEGMRSHYYRKLLGADSGFPEPAEKKEKKATVTKPEPSAAPPPVVEPEAVSADVAPPEPSKIPESMDVDPVAPPPPETAAQNGTPAAPATPVLSEGELSDSNHEPRNRAERRRQKREERALRGSRSPKRSRRRRSVSPWRSRSQSRREKRRRDLRLGRQIRRERRAARRKLQQEGSDENMEEGELSLSSSSSSSGSELSEESLSDSSSSYRRRSWSRSPERRDPGMYRYIRYRRRRRRRDPTDDDVSATKYPPCIRAIVTSSDALTAGALYIVTYSGATLGRDKELNHSIHIADNQVSKMHCEISYNMEEKTYEVTDHASQNGTFVNGGRLSEPKVRSKPRPVSHGDKLTVGGTTLDIHIHPGLETCDKCEPGLVQAKLQQAQKDCEASEGKIDREASRRTQLKQIKKRYGLADTAYTDEGHKVAGGYQDKAESRRKTVGSDNPYQKDDAPASVNREIPQENKGHKLLAKMGWKAGDSLGKTQEGIKEPIQVNLRMNQAAGLGSASGYSQSLDNAGNLQAAEKWVKAQERFNRLEAKEGQGRSSEGQGRSTTFTQGQTETFGGGGDRTTGPPGGT